MKQEGGGKGEARLTNSCYIATKALPYLCLLAEILGTAGPVTKNNFFCIWEAVTWTAMFSLATIAAWRIKVQLPKMSGSNKGARQFSFGLLITGALYIPYMAFVNIPMYVKRYHEDEAAIEAGNTEIEYLNFYDGLPDIAS